MALPSSGPLSFTNLKNEFSATDPVHLSAFYAGGGLVPPGASGSSGPIPSSGAISVHHLYGASVGSLLSGADWSVLSASGTNPGNYLVGSNGLLLMAPMNPTGSYPPEYSPLVSLDFGNSWVQKLSLLVNAKSIYPTLLNTNCGVAYYAYDGNVFWGTATKNSTYPHLQAIISTSDGNSSVVRYVVDRDSIPNSKYDYIDGICPGVVQNQQVLYCSNRLGYGSTPKNFVINTVTGTKTYSDTNSLSSSRVTFFNGASGAIAAGANGVFIAISDYMNANSVYGTIATSFDGVTWTRRFAYDPNGNQLPYYKTSGRFLSKYNNSFGFGCVLNGRYISIVGDEDSNYNFQHLLYPITSDDGITFTRWDPLPDCGPAIINGTIQFQAVFAACDTYVLAIYKDTAGNWIQAVSTDGVSWTVVPSAALSSIIPPDKYPGPLVRVGNKWHLVRNHTVPNTTYTCLI